MAKDKFKDNDVAELIQTIASLRRDVKKISESVRMSVKPVYTNQETMEIFGIASATLKLWRDNGMIGYSQLGKIYLYSKEDISQFLKDHHYDAFKNMKSFVRSVRKEG